MRLLLALVLVLSAATSAAQEQQIQRALIQRDQQSAEFAARARGPDTSRLEQLHTRQLQDAGRPLDLDPSIARALQPYERQKMADERTLVLPPPVARAKPAEELKPLPLPGGMPHVVDPIPAQSPSH
jgi:hypothetical protein